MRVGIIGAGPAGAVCALSLLHGARQIGQQHEVLLFDGKSFLQIGPRGCNMCAGVIPGSLLDALGHLGVEVTPAVVQRSITGHHFETLVGGVDIPKDPAAALYTVFRSAGPRGATPVVEESFDHLVLRSALAAGATFVNTKIAEVRRPTCPTEAFTLRAADGREYEVDVLVGAFGVNSSLAGHFEALGFGYRQPQTFHACQADLPLPPDYLASHYDGKIMIFSLALPGIRFGALTPKRRHVTVTIVGRHLKWADLERFLRHPRVRLHFPPGWEPPATSPGTPTSYCHCHPKVPATAARNPVADRLIIVGDANVSRYLKGGIESAFFTGTLAAARILSGKLTREELVRGYVRPCDTRYRRDNMYGRLLFRWNDLVSSCRLVALASLWLVEREQRLPCWSDRRHTRTLWHIFAGDAPYRTIAREALSPRSLLVDLLALLLGAGGFLRRGGER